MQALAAHLANLSHLLQLACELLPQDRVVYLGKAIKNGWNVEELGIFVEGFLKGAIGPHSALE
jgi:hypothetical protein